MNAFTTFDYLRYSKPHVGEKPKLITNNYIPYEKQKHANCNQPSKKWIETRGTTLKNRKDFFYLNLKTYNHYVH